jgi:hypothetical protein
VAAQLDASNKIAQHRTTIMIPNFPISVNFKIASALGTLAGGLGGAALGAAAPFGAVLGEAALSPHGTNLDQLATAHAFFPHSIAQDHANGTNAEAGNAATEGDILRNSLVGAGVGSAVGSHLTQKQPYPPMGAPKLATAYFEKVAHKGM